MDIIEIHLKKDLVEIRRKDQSIELTADQFHQIIIEAIVSMPQDLMIDTLEYIIQLRPDYNELVSKGIDRAHLIVNATNKN